MNQRNRTTFVSIWLLTSVVVSHAAAQTDVDTFSPTTQPNTIGQEDTERQRQARLLSRLHAAGLISDALLERRRQKLRNIAPPVAPPTTALVSNTKEMLKGNDVALVIGSNDYTHLEPLQTAVNDAVAISRVLQQDFGFDVELLQNPDRYTLVSALAKYRDSLSADDRFLLYYAGHGQLDPITQRGYWLPVDAESDNPSNWVSTTEISDALLSLDAEHVLVIADSCYAASLSGGVQPVPAQSRVRSRTVITSGGLEPVLDSSSGDHSIFAKALLDQLTKYQQGSTLSDLFEHVKQEVQRHADQTPQYSVIKRAGHERGEFMLRKKEV